MAPPQGSVPSSDILVRDVSTALSEAEVLSLAQQEGLTLMEAPGSSTGYKGVQKQTTTAGRFMARASG